MPEKKMTYQERVKFLAQKHADQLNDGTYKLQWFDMKGEAKVTIAAQAQAIREALMIAFNWDHAFPGISESVFNNRIDDYLLEHGYIEPKTEDDGCKDK